MQPFPSSPDIAHPAPWADVADQQQSRLPPARASTSIRMLAMGGGIVALLVGSVLSFGMGFVAVVGVAAAAGLCRARNARLTRRASWVGAVLAVSIFFGGFAVWAMVREPGSITESMRQSIAQANREPPPPLVRRLQRFGPPPNPRVQGGADRMMQSTAFVWWTMVMGLVLGSVFVGLLVGTPAWGCAMLIGYGVLGRWPMPRPAPAR